MSLPRGVMGWSTVCDCGSPGHTNLHSKRNKKKVNKVIKGSMCRSDDGFGVWEGCLASRQVWVGVGGLASFGVIE